MLTNDIKVINSYEINNILKNNTLSLIEEINYQEIIKTPLDSNKHLTYSFNFYEYSYWVCIYDR